jgi:hypothetical protein
MARKKPGPAPGTKRETPGNPQGRNQYADASGHGERSSKPISAKLPRELDEQVRAIATAEGKTVTQIAEEAFMLLIESRQGEAAQSQ